MPTRRTAGAAAPATRAAAPAKASGGSVNFGDDSFLSSGFTLPRGNWCIFFEMKRWKPEKGRFEAQVGAFGTCYNLDAPDADPVTYHWGMGGNAHLSFLPSEDGFGLDPVPNAPSQSVGAESRYGLLRTSLKNCALPKGILSNSIEPINGIWVHIEQIDEPESWKDAKAKDLGEGGEAKAAGKIPVVTQILDGGKPWEGGGGWPAPGYVNPETAPARTARPAPPAAAAGRRQPAAPAPAPEPAADETVEETSLSDAIIDSMGKVVAENGTVSKLRVDTFAQLKADWGDDAEADAKVMFDKDKNAVLNFLTQLGYKLRGQIVILA